MLLIAALVAQAAQAENAASPISQVRRGERVAQEQCLACHLVAKKRSNSCRYWEATCAQFPKYRRPPGDIRTEAAGVPGDDPLGTEDSAHHHAGRDVSNADGTVVIRYILFEGALSREGPAQRAALAARPLRANLPLRTEVTSMTAAKTHGPNGHHHALVWIDHHEARIFRFDAEVSEATHHVVRDEHSPAHLHHKANSSGQRPVYRSVSTYLEKVAEDIKDARAILIVGPSSAKHEFYKHPELHQQGLAEVGCWC